MAGLWKTYRRLADLPKTGAGPDRNVLQPRASPVFESGGLIQISGARMIRVRIPEMTRLLRIAF